ncbi:MAG: non-heme iron oxygenase ferredoxin subunit [Mycobacteriaceae bacterium]|nr:non-heme iron oxygenase ferredoxin subunit [Mycobacteriaceae bacterium]
MKYVVVAQLSQLSTGRGYPVMVDKSAVALFLVDERVHAIDDRCTHAGASLAAGEVCDGEVTCPRHGAVFDVRSGEAIGPPAEDDVATWPVRVVDGRVEIGIE